MTTYQTDELQEAYVVSSEPPNSREAEEAVIGSVLINPEVYHEIRMHIQKADEFYVVRHKMIWSAIESMFKRNIPVDLLTLSNELETQGSLNEIGGPPYLTAMVNQVPSSLNAPSYAAIVHGHHVRRRMIDSANEIATISYNAKIELDEGISKATHSLSDAVSEAIHSRSNHISDSLKRVDAKIDERGKSLILPGIPTGLIDLDNLLGGGAQNSDLLMISARPGQGKTSLLLQLAKNAAYHTINQKVFQKRVAIFSLEMPEEQVVLRLLSQISGIEYQVLHSGRIPQIQIADYIHALDELSSLDIVIDDTSGVSPAYIRSRCEIINAEKKLDVVFVDSLNLMRSGINFKGRTDLEVDYNATELKSIARDFSIPLWASHQMNRNKEHRGGNSRPVLSDLREGGEQPTDVVMFLWHKMNEQNEKLIDSSEIILEKHRNGPSGSVPVVFLGSRTKFESAYIPKKP